MRILIVDDHSVVRRGLQQILASRGDWIVDDVGTADEVLPALRGAAFDAVVLDVSLGARSGIDVLAEIRTVFPSLPVLILSMHSEEQYAIRCLRAGASGYIQKDRSPEELIGAVERVVSGRTYVSEVVAEQMAAELVRGIELHPHERLSAREFEVFRLIGAGRTVGEIAETLHLSVKTVSTYRSRILEKTGFHSNAEIMAYAIRSDLV